MANDLYIWSDDPAAWWSASASRDAEGGAKEDKGNTVLVVQVLNISDFESHLQSWVKSSQSFDLMEFHTHGGGGAIGLGPEALTAENLKHMELRGYDAVLKPGATINLTGCNCAEGAYGELLLVQFALTLLRTGGGYVKGNTGAGIAVGALFSFMVDSGAVWHPFGHWVTAQATPGGAVTLSNHFYLNPDTINARIEHIEKCCPDLDEDELPNAQKALDQAKTYLPPRAAADYWNYYWACYFVQQAGKVLEQHHWRNKGIFGYG